MAVMGRPDTRKTARSRSRVGHVHLDDGLLPRPQLRRQDPQVRVREAGVGESFAEGEEGFRLAVQIALLSPGIHGVPALVAVVVHRQAAGAPGKGDGAPALGVELAEESLPHGDAPLGPGIVADIYHLVPREFTRTTGLYNNLL